MRDQTPDSPQRAMPARGGPPGSSGGAPAPGAPASGTSDRAPALVEHFFRHEYGRTVSALVRRFGAARIELVEDAVQHAMMKALTAWGLHGVPENAGAWLTRSASNAVLDKLRHARVQSDKADTVRGMWSEAEAAPALPALSRELGDDELRMLFVCCDEGLKPRTQLILALKFLCGFSVSEIALRLFMGENAVKKRVSRGRQHMRALAPDMDTPGFDKLAGRLDAVHQVLYLLFNEGYSAAQRDAHIRRELCDEALRLIAFLCAHPVASTASWALRGLMHMHHARLDARTDAHGGLVLLEEQDRSRWDRVEIQTGMRCLYRAGNTPPLSRYHVEAAIVLEHCTAPSYAATKWGDIAQLYAALDRMQPSPLHTMNRAVALAEHEGPEAGLALLERLTPPAWLSRYYLWDATLGRLRARAGHTAQAKVALERARDRAPTNAERDRLTAWLDALGS